VSFVSLVFLFASAPVSFALCFDEGSSAAELVCSCVSSVLADLSVEGFAVYFVFGEHGYCFVQFEFGL
jgi:hypothetical protein